MNLYAKKRGAKLIIHKKDGHLITGELITVKEHSLLLLSATDESIDISDIFSIKIVYKSKAGQGAAIGFLIPVSILASLIFATKEDVGWIPLLAILYGVPGALIGGIFGAIAGTDKTIQLEGMTDSEIQETLDKLRKKARIRDYK